MLSSDDAIVLLLALLELKYLHVITKHENL